jgi:hypothetical protein
MCLGVFLYDMKMTKRYKSKFILVGFLAQCLIEKDTERGETGVAG